jgi:hypothetical protein
MSDVTLFLVAGGLCLWLALTAVIHLTAYCSALVAVARYVGRTEGQALLLSVTRAREVGFPRHYSSALLITSAIQILAALPFGFVVTELIAGHSANALRWMAYASLWFSGLWFMLLLVDLCLRSVSVNALERSRVPLILVGFIGFAALYKA